jgi:hypothetical protein
MTRGIPAFAQSIVVGNTIILPADTTTLKTIFTAGSEGALIDSIVVSSSDTSSKDVQFWSTREGVDYLLFTVNIPANSGFTSSVGITSILDSTRTGSTTTPAGWQVLDAIGNKLVRFGALEGLKVKALTNVTASKAIYVRASGTTL